MTRECMMRLVTRRALGYVLAAVDEVASMMATYMRDLLFQQDEHGRFIGSPYDNFLRVNHLPMQPLAGETRAHYNLRLYNQVAFLASLTEDYDDA